MQKKTNRIVAYAYIVSLVAATVVLLLFGVRNNSVEKKTRPNGSYHVVDSYQVEEIEDENAPIGIKKEYSWSIDNTQGQDDCLAFYVVHQYVKIYIEDEFQYSLFPRTDFHIGKTLGSDWVMIPLYSEDAGKEIVVEITPVYEEVRNREVEFLTGSRLEIYTKRLEADLPQIIASVLAIVVGMIFCVIALYEYRRKKHDMGLTVIGLFSVYVGLWRLTDTRFSPFLFPGNTTLLFHISLITLMIGITPVVRAVQYELQGKYHLIFNICFLIYSGVSIVQFVLQILDISDLRESLFITHILIFLAGIVTIGVLIYDKIRNRKKITQYMRGGLFLICVVGGLVDVIFYYIKGHSSGLMFSLYAFLAYVIIVGILKISEYMKHERYYHEQEAQLAASRISIMLSQIQPHFLYNSLNSIYYLCEKNPGKAQQAISDFSDYLRGNLDSLKNTVPVAFETELRHVEIYLSLEKMRFEEHLNIIYDIRERDFKIPALTVQPLVENAVKYGVGKAQNGGNVIISTVRCRDYIEVSVADDGVGYDVNEEKCDDRSHIGIENVRDRLWEMSRATLEIESEKNKGTRAIIKIPNRAE